MRNASSAATLFVASIALVSTAAAGPKEQAAREAAEYIVRKFSGEAIERGATQLTARLESLAVRYGDDVFTAARKIGPRAITALESAGDDGVRMAALLAREGDKALWVVENPARMALARYGDDAAEAMIKHKSIAEPLVSQFKEPAAAALNHLNGQNARRLAEMAADGDLAKLGHTRQLFDTVAKYGDRAMKFIWDNKGALMVGTAAAAFFADPQPFLDGTRDLASVGLEKFVTPVGRDIAQRTDWTWLGIAAIVTLAVCGLIKFYIRARFKEAV
jgi:hypothetical protein